MTDQKVQRTRTAKICIADKENIDHPYILDYRLKFLFHNHQSYAIVIPII